MSAHAQALTGGHGRAPGALRRPVTGPSYLSAQVDESLTQSKGEIYIHHFWGRYFFLPGALAPRPSVTDACDAPFPLDAAAVCETCAGCA
jgi:hypothetical protein